MSRPCPQCAAPAPWKNLTILGTVIRVDPDTHRVVDGRALVNGRAQTEAVLSCAHCTFTVHGHLDYDPRDYNPHTGLFTGGNFYASDPQTGDNSPGA